jgi:hypothetical protein
MDGATLTTPVEPAVAQDPASARDPADYTCECGHQLRVFGGGRHRIYFPRDNVGLDSPIMDGVCPQCGRPLPGKQ